MSTLDPQEVRVEDVLAELPPDYQREHEVEQAIRQAFANAGPGSSTSARAPCATAPTESERKLAMLVAAVAFAIVMGVGR